MPVALNSPLFADLFDGVDDLMRRVADAENPEIRRSRAKVYAASVAAKAAVQNNGPYLPVLRAENPPSYREYRHPGTTLGVALLAGVGLGLMCL
jgi:hypothetical protein